MPLIATATLQPNSLGPSANLQVYNGLDACVTLEVLEELQRTFPAVPEIYAFERALQGPYLDMMMRGFAVDDLARRRAAEGLHERVEVLKAQLNALAEAVWGRGLNPRSHKQCLEFFYGALGLPEQWISQKGQRKLAMNREVLEKLEAYLIARPFVACALGIRELEKQLEVLETQIDSDLRWRASYNIAGTETGRPSSSTNAYGTGGNAQNIAPGLRFVFVSDLGWKLVVIDLEQVEARDVGYFCGCILGDWSYLNAAESGDLHTANARLIWPELPWTGDIRHDRKLAERQFYREFSHRDMSKRGGHLTNYHGTAWTASRHLKVPIAMMEEFQARYVLGRNEDMKHGLPAITPAFPCIPRWWQWVAQQLQTQGHLTTPFGRQRHFFGRPGDDTTLREAIAFLPQSTTADRMNLGLWRVWKYMPEVQLLAQTYDSITFQVREGPGFDEAVGRALELIRVELRAANGRSYIVPGEAKVGWNWGNRHDEGKPLGPGNRFNPEGLVKWQPGKDKRERATGLQRLMPD